MPNPLKKIIERQLKENIPLSLIKRNLKERGYSFNEINRASREIISGAGGKKVTFQIAVLVIGVALAVGIAVYFNVNQQPSSHSACNDFPNTTASCENAITIALESYPGEFLGVSRGLIEFPQKNSTLAIRSVWSVVINLKEPLPFNDKNVSKLVVQVGIGDQIILAVKEAL